MQYSEQEGSNYEGIFQFEKIRRKKKFQLKNKRKNMLFSSKEKERNIVALLSYINSKGTSERDLATLITNWSPKEEKRT